MAVKAKKGLVLMLKQIVRWFVAMLALTLIALTLLLSPVLGSHAAAPHISTHHSHTIQTQDATPNIFWRP
jgi:hypothetical protein